MLMDIIAAVSLLVCLTCFAAVNLHNIFREHKRESDSKPYAEVEQPLAFVVIFAAVGTLVYGFEMLLHVFFALTESISALAYVSLQAPYPILLVTQIIGLAFTLLGYFFFIWSIIARGKYATSWKMTKEHRLVTWGPYRHVRHPSYLGYFLMFFGLFFLWPNLLTLFPLTAIPGYFRVTFREEELLTARFGDEYRKYQRKTRRFIPRFW
jgi:protein-S-isoprenylcysteine O-methyltransferase Ste14